MTKYTLRRNGNKGNGADQNKPEQNQIMTVYFVNFALKLLHRSMCHHSIPAALYSCTAAVWVYITPT